jgi:hypothetical protein
MERRVKIGTNWVFQKLQVCNRKMGASVIWGPQSNMWESIRYPTELETFRKNFFHYLELTPQGGNFMR